MEDDGGALGMEVLRGRTKALVDECNDAELLDLVYRLLLAE